MRPSFPAILFGLLIGLLSALGQENVVQSFDGTNSSTSPLFKTQDKWELRWDSLSRINITLLSADGTVITGLSASATGSFYQSKGGSFYLQIDRTDNSGSSPWHVQVVELGTAQPTAAASVANYFPPTVISPPGQTNSTGVAAMPPSTNETNAPTVSDAILAATPAKLTQDQSRAIVVIKGDAAEGTGFLTRTPDGPVVVTNNHVVAANPNIKILTSAGQTIPFLSFKGAVDRDLVMFVIKDDHYSYLELGTDIEHTVVATDEVLTPGNSEGGEVVLTTDGMVLGVGPDRIEFSNPIYHGNSGGPIFHVKSGKVIGVVTLASKVKVTNDLDQASYNNAKSAITGPMRYFGFRLDSVPKWEPYDLDRFLNESTFLKQFHLDSRCLDSFLNGARYEKAHLTSLDMNDGYPNARFYQQNDKLRTSADSFRQFASNADKSQQLDAQRELVMDLQGFADKDITAIQAPNNFYAFDQIRAKEELAYRAALKAELESIGDKITDLGH